MGPLEAPMSKKAGKYRFQLLIWSDTRAQRHACLCHMQVYLAKLPEAKRVRWSFDIDPIDLG